MGKGINVGLKSILAFVAHGDLQLISVALAQLLGDLFHGFVTEFHCEYLGFEASAPKIVVGSFVFRPLSIFAAHQNRFFPAEVQIFYATVDHADEVVEPIYNAHLIAIKNHKSRV